jgi:hypothetical protein
LQLEQIVVISKVISFKCKRSDLDKDILETTIEVVLEKFVFTLEDRQESLRLIKSAVFEKNYQFFTVVSTD